MQLTVSPILDLTELVSHWSIVDMSVGPDADLLLLVLSQSPDFITKDGRATRSAKVRSQPEEKYHFRIYHQHQDSFKVIDLQPTGEKLRFVQPCGPANWLAVRQFSKANHNAYIYREDGLLQHSFHIGQAIEQVQTDEAGYIWTGYRDETCDPGVVCFTPTGQLVFDYYACSGIVNIPSIIHCYALNVCSQHDIWLYTYIDFPLIHIHDRQIQAFWENMPIAGSNAFAIEQNQALFAGSYSQKTTLFLVSLDTLKVEEITPVDKNGVPLAFSRSCGRGSRLYLMTESAIFMLDLKTITLS